MTFTVDTPSTDTGSAETAAPAAATPAETAPAPFPRRWLGLIAILAATLLNLLDASIVNVAAPAIRTELGGTAATIQWLAAGYTLALAVGLLTGGRLGDMFGRKRILVIGLVGFLAASLACGAAESIELLLAARVVQGAFAAVMIPQCFGLIRDMFGREMGKAYAVFGPLIGLASIGGPILAGVLVEADLFGTGWRSIFLINLPLGIAALALGAKILPAGAPIAKGLKLDLGGALIAAAGMGLLLYPLVEGHEAGWPTWSLVMLASSAPVLALFAVTQVKRARSGKSALIELSVFTKRSYVSGVAFCVVFFGAVTGFSLAVGLFLQLGLGFSPLKASLAMAAWAVGAFIGSGASAGLAPKLGRAVLHLGLGTMAAGLTVLWFQFGTAAAPGTWSMAPALLIFGIGMGMIFVPLFGIITGELEDHEVGSASGLLESFQQGACALGVAGLGTVFFGRFAIGGGEAEAMSAAQLVTGLTIALTIVAFLVVFGLPKQAKAEH
ncbi:MFS transporter [Glycomyces harbinensis]|uniref:Drug resistance transporter, EmrB/QacA subfamily n=1 Tax=Glycomyces harbinensis TaxID=58114 RepID=A0A1G6SBY7_9ACTN|nr:MFS transporter [Glycomyces harbinensis]SDD14408.1 drug resistance transporter, EmrB/QacA subfamily [Glycomyces harbinensis]